VARIVKNFGTSAADLVQIIGFISFVVLALFLLVQFSNKNRHLNLASALILLLRKLNNGD